MTDVARIKPLRQPILNRKQATNRFNREMAIIISKVRLILIKQIVSPDKRYQCEALAEETGCWLVIAGHAGADTSAIHFTSDALRREAEDDATNLVKGFMAITSNLKQARFRDASDLARDLAEKEAEIKALKLRYQGDD